MAERRQANAPQIRPEPRLPQPRGPGGDVSWRMLSGDSRREPPRPGQPHRVPFDTTPSAGLGAFRIRRVLCRQVDLTNGRLCFTLCRVRRRSTLAERIGSGLREARLRAALSRSELAARARTTRQTIAGLEAGAYAPTMPVALRLARALGRDVGELFWLETPREIEAEYVDPIAQARVTVARVAGRVIALAAGQSGPTDGIAWARDSGAGAVTVALFDDATIADRTAIVAGCDPALPALAEQANRRHAPLRVVARPAGSTTALQRLHRGEAHAAGLHLRDAATDQWNLPAIRTALPGRNVLVVTIAHWALGLLVAPGNPRGIHSAADLLRGDVTIVNREPGSGGRSVLDRALAGQVTGNRWPRGYDRVVHNHTAVAEIVAAGFADAGPGAMAAAPHYGLDFVPLEQERFDLVIPAEFVGHAPVQALLATLTSAACRAELALLPGYDTSATGDTVWNGLLQPLQPGSVTNDVA